MNVELLNDWQEIPESVGATLEDSALCARFNPTGRLIAAGRSDGWTTIWDLETRGVLRSLEGHPKSIMAVSWSRNSRYLLTASRDWNCIIWDLGSGDRKRTTRFDAPVMGASFHPQNSQIFIATLSTQQTFLVDLRSGEEQRFELVEYDLPDEENPDEAKDVNLTPQRPTMTLARFDHDGKYVYAGTSQGYILIFHSRTKAIIKRIKIANNSSIKQLEFDSSGKSLAISSNDRIVRVYTIDGGFDLDLRHRFQDMINRTPWNGVSWSGNGDYVIAGAAHKAAHTIYIWDKETGNLEKILEGPKEPLLDVHWHPMKPSLCSVTTSGLIHIWSTTTTEKWGAFAAGFEELDENLDYEEREDEFDIEDEEAILKRKREQEEQDVDVAGIDDQPLPVAEMDAIGEEEEARLDRVWLEHDPDDDVVPDFFPPVRMDDYGDEMYM